MIWVIATRVFRGGGLKNGGWGDVACVCTNAPHFSTKQLPSPPPPPPTLSEILDPTQQIIAITMNQGLTIGLLLERSLVKMVEPIIYKGIMHTETTF